MKAITKQKFLKSFKARNPSITCEITMTKNIIGWYELKFSDGIDRNVKFTSERISEYIEETSDLLERIKGTNLTFMSSEEEKQYVRDANEYLNNKFFSRSYRTQSVYALAEYLASKDGKAFVNAPDLWMFD